MEFYPIMAFKLRKVFILSMSLVSNGFHMVHLLQDKQSLQFVAVAGQDGLGARQKWRASTCQGPRICIMDARDVRRRLILA